MSISTIKKILLGGTALVAVAAFGAQAHATTYTLTGPVTWGENGAANGGPATGAGAGGNVILANGTTLNITNDGTANDGSGNTNTFTLGSITDTGAIPGPAVTINTGSANNLGVTIGSVTLAASTSQAAFTVENTNNGANAVAVGVTGAFSTTGALTLTNADTTASAVNLTIGGAATVTGATSVTGGLNAGNTTTLTLNGAGTNTFTGGLTLTNGAAGAAGLNVTGSAAQTVAGTVSGNGTIIVDNANGATFSGTVAAGSVVVDKGAGNSSVTFQNTVNAPITLGHAAGAVNGVTFGTVTAGDTNTVTFDSTSGSFGVTGAIAGANVTQTNDIAVIGGHTVTLNTASNTNLNNLAVSGTGTNFTLGAALAVTNTTIGSGATVTTGANNLTSIVDGLADGVGTLAVTGNSTVSGNIGNTHALAAVNVATGDTLTAQGTFFKATTTTVSGTGAVTLSNAPHTVNTNFAADATGNGTLNTGTGLVTEAGDIGTSTVKFGTVAIGNAGTFETTGNVYANAITGGNASSTLEFNGTGAQTVSGTYNTGILTVADSGAGSSVTFNGILGGGTGLASIGVNSGATAVFDANATSTGALTNAGTISVAPGVTVTAGTIAAGSNTYDIGFNGTAAGKLVATGGAVSLASSTLVAQVPTNAGYIASGTNYVIATGNAAATATAGGAVTSNNALYSFADTVSGNNIVLTATRNAYAALGGPITSNDSSVGTALNTIGTTAGFSTLQSSLGSATTSTAVHNILQSVTPTVDGGAQAAVLSVGAETQDVANVRMSSLRDGDNKTGVAAGASANGVSMWLEGYGQHAVQDTMDSVNGYSANTWGGVVGADSTALVERAVLGVAFNYGHSKVESDNANSTHTGIDNYGLDLYGTYDLGNKFFVAGQGGYAYNKINSDRYNVGGAGGPTASSDTHSNVWSARADLGRNYPMDGGLTLTPDVSANYANVDTAAYNETGAGVLDQNVNSENQNVLALGIGGTATWKIKDDENIMKPSLHAGYAYNAINDKVQTTSSFAGDPGVSFVTEGASPARNVFDVGAKLVYETKANWDISATYDFQAKEDYTSHTGEVRATAHF